MQAAAKKFQDEDTRSEWEVKGVVLVLVCYFYGLFLFLLFGAMSKLGQYITYKLNEQMKKFQFWNVDKKSVSKYDINHNIRPLKHIGVGTK